MSGVGEKDKIEGQLRYRSRSRRKEKAEEEKDMTKGDEEDER